MKVNGFVSHTLQGVRTGAALLAVLQLSVGPVLAAAAVPAFGGPWNSSADQSGRTVTPIKHVIVIIGENRSFDHVFATYLPRPGQTVHNLLSEGIIQLDANKNAIPGPHFHKAQQLSASDLGAQDSFLLSPPKQEFPGNQLPAPEAGGPSGAQGYFTPSSSKYTTIACGTITANGKTTTNYLDPAACAALTENGLPDASDANGLTYYQSLASGGTNQYSYTPDLRIVNFDSLPAGPFQLTNGTNSATSGYSLTYTDYSASPVHRFYQMWQQLNCSLEHASWDNPSGCNGKLFSWVEATVHRVIERVFVGSPLRGRGRIRGGEPGGVQEEFAEGRAIVTLGVLGLAQPVGAGTQWNNYVNDPYQLNYGTKGPNSDEYCNICNPFQYDTSIMSNPAQIAAHIQDTVNLYSDITNGTLPAVSFVKPSGYVDGHPSSSKQDLFEGFVKKIVDQVEASPTYTKDTVILITEDEGGGYYDSGYVQPLDFFGDGTRIPLIVVANPQYLPLRASGYISHRYADHVSILKFIEHNWRLRPVTRRSRDNFPNPVQLPGSYAPVNAPALDDLFDFFDFRSWHGFF